MTHTGPVTIQIGRDLRRCHPSRSGWLALSHSHDQSSYSSVHKSSHTHSFIWSVVVIQTGALSNNQTKVTYIRRISCYIAVLLPEIWLMNRYLNKRRFCGNISGLREKRNSRSLQPGDLLLSFRTMTRLDHTAKSLVLKNTSVVARLNEGCISD